MDYANVDRSAEIQEGWRVRKGAIVVCAGRPELGAVKSRLESVIGNETTLSLYRENARRILGQQRRALDLQSQAPLAP